MTINLYYWLAVLALMGVVAAPSAAISAEGGGTTVFMVQTPQTTAVIPEMYEMNGIRLKDYPDFEKKWKQVTVRFRTDTGEQRFTYANDIAYQALLKGSKDYPNGAVFAKVGILTVEDPEFPSSKVPAGTQRIQFMVRDKKKYAAADGWGYAVFNPMGLRMDTSMPPEDQAKACNTCHQIVARSRGAVFSRPMALWGNNAVTPPPLPPSNQMPKTVLGPEVVFSTEQASLRDELVSKLPEKIQKLLPGKVASVRFVEGAMRDHVFSGTLNEIRPLLIRETALSGRPALLLSRDGRQYALIMADNKKVAAACANGLEGFRVYWSGYAASAPAGDLQTLTESICVKRSW